MVEWLKQIFRAAAEHDPASWVSHWIIAFGLSVGVSNWYGVRGGLIAASILLAIFLGREVENYLRLGKRRDSLMDMAGPVLCFVIFLLAHVLNGGR